jgi:nucleotide-binding universal stress UspA family protein
MYQHILVAVDGSHTADLALRAAIALAKTHQAELRLIHVVDDTVTTLAGGLGADAVAAGLSADTVFQALRDAGRAVIDRGLATARQSGLEAQGVLRETIGQRVATVLAQAAAEWPADVVVIGTHGRRGVDRLLLGSVAEGVVRLSTQPVLIVPGKHQ